MKIKNFKINQKAASKLAACVLVGTLVATTLTGCGTKVDRDLNTDKNRAMVSIGNEYFVVDIDGYTRWTDSNTELKLTDGTLLSVHPSDLQLYNGQSEVMQNVENSVSAVQIYNSDYQVNEGGYDRAFVQVGDSIIVVEISGFTRWTDSNTELKLTDGTSLNVHPMDLSLFNSKSSIMDQVQEQTLNNDNSKTR